MMNRSATEEEQDRLGRFLEALKARGSGENTLKAYRSDWEQFARWYLETNGEPFDLRRLASIDLVDYRSHEQRRGRAAATINRRLAFLKRYVGWADRKDETAPDVAARVGDVAPIGRQRLAPRGLAKPETRRLLRELELRGNPRDEAVIYTLLYTGLRVGELVHLTIADLELSPQKGTIHVRGPHVKGAKERSVPAPVQARRRIGAYLDERRSEAELRVFLGQRGPIREDAVDRIVKKYAGFARIDGVSPHTLRHTFAYNYLENTQNDLVGLAKILGHESLTTTQVYTQKSLSALQEQVEKVGFY